MNKKSGSRKIIFAFYLILIHTIAGYLIYDKFFKVEKPAVRDEVQSVIELPTPIDIPPPTNLNLPQNSQITAIQPKPETSLSANVNSANNLAPQLTTNDGKLLIPVVGIKKSDLRDTFNDARSEGRVHNAIDIMAKGGTPVIAAADGEIAKFFESKLGGITIYQYSVDKKQVFYYAHLQKRADNLTEHQFVKQGTVIAYVGDTGNAGTGNFHLHFAISNLTDPQRYWDGEAINPYPILLSGKEAN